jgi:hypothetical protein
MKAVRDEHQLREGQRQAVLGLEPRGDVETEAPGLVLPEVVVRLEVAGGGEEVAGLRGPHPEGHELVQGRPEEVLETDRILAGTGPRPLRGQVDGDVGPAAVGGEPDELRTGEDAAGLWREVHGHFPSVSGGRGATKGRSS